MQLAALPHIVAALAFGQSFNGAVDSETCILRREMTVELDAIYPPGFQHNHPATCLTLDRLVRARTSQCRAVAHAGLSLPSRDCGLSGQSEDPGIAAWDPFCRATAENEDLEAIGLAT